MKNTYSIFKNEKFLQKIEATSEIMALFEANINVTNLLMTNNKFEAQGGDDLYKVVKDED